MPLNIATCQFPVDGDIHHNLRHTLRQMTAAKDGGAHVAHFSECSLSGYAGVEFPSFENFDWDALASATQTIAEEAARLRLWTIFGSAHRLTGRHKPHNCLYILNDRGRLVDRFDKLYCTGDRTMQSADLLHYSPGDHFTVFTIRGIRCGALICHDFRYPELYREYRRRRVDLIFNAYHNGHVNERHYRRGQVDPSLWNLNHGKTIHGIIVPPTVQGHAASNAMWISCNNTSARESSWPSFFVRPDGLITGRLTRNRAGILFSSVDPKKKFYDASEAWRDRAMRGVYHSGKLVKDRRSAARKKW